jgi:hypothetical protein
MGDMQNYWGNGQPAAEMPATRPPVAAPAETAPAEVSGIPESWQSNGKPTNGTMSRAMAQRISDKISAAQSIRTDQLSSYILGKNLPQGVSLTSRDSLKGLSLDQLKAAANAAYDQASGMSIADWKAMGKTAGLKSEVSSGTIRRTLDKITQFQDAVTQEVERQTEAGPKAPK